MGFTKTPGWCSWSRGGGRNVHGIYATSTKLLACLPVLIGQALPTRSAMAQEVGQRFRDCPTRPEMVVVPAGTFIMGSPESENGRLRAVYDEEGTAISKRGDIPMVREIVTNPELIVRVTPYASGPVTATFDLTGAREAIGRVAEACGCEL